MRGHLSKKAFVDWYHSSRWSSRRDEHRTIIMFKYSKHVEISRRESERDRAKQEEQNCVEMKSIDGNGGRLHLSLLALGRTHFSKRNTCSFQIISDTESEEEEEEDAADDKCRSSFQSSMYFLLHCTAISIVVPSSCCSAFLLAALGRSESKQMHVWQTR